MAVIPRLSWTRRLRQSPIAVIAIVLLIVFLFFSFAAPNFLTFYALSNVLTFASVFGIVVVGIAFLMISGEFELSVRSTIAIAGYVFLYALLRGVAPVFAMLLALVSCALLGLLNGLIVIWTGLPSFITTLGTMLAYFGIVRAMGGGKPIGYTPAAKPVLFDILNGYIAPINQLTDPAGNLRVASVWFVLAVIVMTFVLTRTQWGNWTFAVGGNPAEMLRRLPVGLTEWAIHVGVDTPELRTLMPAPGDEFSPVERDDRIGTWRGRKADLELSPRPTPVPSSPRRASWS